MSSQKKTFVTQIRGAQETRYRLRVPVATPRRGVPHRGHRVRLGQQPRGRHHREVPGQVTRYVPSHLGLLADPRHSEQLGEHVC